MPTTDDQRRILDMLAAGSITADEAQSLLGALGSHTAGGGVLTATTTAPEFLRVRVRPTEGDGSNVDVRVPIGLIRGGVRLASLLPEQARGRVQVVLSEHLGEDIEIEKLKTAEIDRILESLYGLELTATHGNHDIRVWCE